ncbi:MAG: anthranilate synthase component I [Candidatus Latescibacterota bacterium]|nr:MAG: anthranilate synthase component I [Candidatus Latescibacterota bacterium]
MTTPSWPKFQELARQGTLVPLSREILADLETPVSAYLKLGEEHSFLLESVEVSEKWARYSILGIDPMWVVRSAKGEWSATRPQGAPLRGRSPDPLEPVEKILRSEKAVPVEGLPPFVGGAVGFLGYDAVRSFEKLPSKTRADRPVPEALFLFPRTLLVFDNLTHSVRVLTHVPTGKGRSAKAEYEKGARRIDEVIRRLRRPVPARPERRPVGRVSYTSTLGKSEYCRQVKRIQKWIREGEIFQAVLAQRLETTLRSDPFDVYRALRTINPSPYMYYFNLGDLKIIGSSPEVLVRERDGKIEVRPIAGTRPRGRDPVEEEAIARELRSDEKERAEHLMLVDLGRNDIGRVSEYGTVVTDEFQVLEKYSHVMHLVSNVSGRLRKGLTPFDLLRACFPAGTVTGAPKIRAMELIEEVEPVRRGIYGGAVGYFGYGNRMDMCIAIRTIVVQGDCALIGAGAGIVADSVPELEYQETLNKAGALRKAIETAARGLD